MKEIYLIIGSIRESNIQRIKKLGEKVGLDIRPFFLSSCANYEDFYPNSDSYRIGISNILNDGFSGMVWANESGKMSSGELEFWVYMEMLAKKVGKKVLREWELKSPAAIDFESLKNPSQKTQETMSNITRTFQDAVQNAMSMEEKNDNLKRRLNSLYGFKPENGNIEYNKYQDVYHVEEIFPGPTPITVDIDISIGGRGHSRGDSLWEHGSCCNHCAGRSGKSGPGRDASGGGCSSKSDGQSKISE